MGVVATPPSEHDTLAPESEGDAVTLAGELAAPSTGRPPDPRELLVDQAGPLRLGHHVLLHELGHGGMGVVYAAYDEKLDRKVAIKLLRTRESAMLQRRLAREAQAMARLSHPNVVQVYEIGEWQQLAFLVMEFVDGQTLRAWLAEAPRARADVLAAFVAAGRGLAAAHAQGLVHRDFKPDNVMIRRDGRAMVMDFGLARGNESSDLESSGESIELSIDRSSELSVRLTQAGALTGTPGYMAPEQFHGQDTDARTDQFSFCVALWEALYGERPFRGENVAALALAVTEGKPSAPSEHVVPTWLRRVIERGLARDPKDRWPSMDELLAALEHDPTRRRAGLLLGATVLALALAGIFGARVDQARQREAAIAACEREGQALAEAWNDDVEGRLEQVFVATDVGYARSAWSHARRWMDEYARGWSELRVATCRETHVDRTRSQASHDAIMACLDQRRATFSGLLEVWSHADGKLVARAPIAASALTPLSTCTTGLRERDSAPEAIRERVAQLGVELEQARAMHLSGEYEPGLAKALEIVAEAERLDWPPLLAEARLVASNLQMKSGKYAEGRRSGEQAFLDAIRAGDDSAMQAAAQSLTFLIGSELRDFDQGLLWGEIAMRLLVRLELSGTVREAGLLEDIGNIRLSRGEVVEAVELQRRALAIKQAVLGPEHPSVASCHINLGGALAAGGDHRTAHEHFDTAVRIKAETLGEDHPDVATAISNIGTSYFFEADYEKARAAMTRALELREAALGAEHPQVADTLTNLALAQAALGDYEAAKESLVRAISVFERALGSNHAVLIGPLNNLGMVRVLDGEDEQAIALYRRAVAIVEESLGPQHPDGAGTWINWADLELARGRAAQAREHYERALTHLAESPDHPFAGLAISGLGRAALELGDLDVARERLETAGAMLGPQNEPIELAKTRFGQARIAAIDGDPGRARELATVARERAVAAGHPGRQLVAAIDAWLAELPATQSP
jgi:tetratricopeptide (TPR) repeat protein/predicted Ser/Thr protein kinase